MTRAIAAAVCILGLGACSGCSDSQGTKIAEVYCKGPYWAWAAEGAEKHYVATLSLYTRDAPRPRAVVLVPGDPYAWDMKDIRRVLVGEKYYDLEDEWKAGGVYRLDLDAGTVTRLRYELGLLLEQLEKYDPHSGLSPELSRLWGIGRPAETE